MSHKMLINEYSRKLLGIIRLLCSVRRIVFDFSPRCIDYLVPGSWPPEQYQAWVLSHGAGLNSDQMVVGCSCYFCAIIAQHIMQTDPHCRLKGL